MRERALEYALCARLERERDWLVSRQLGGGVHDPGGRVLDVVGIATTDDVDRRARLTDASIPASLVTAAIGPGVARRWHAIDGLPTADARRIVDRGVGVGFLDREYRGGQEYVRQVERYPQWVERLVGVELKPDLGSPGALERQLRADVSLGVLDAVVLATRSYVTGAHRNRLPEAVGIWRIGADGSIAVEREPATLDPKRHGLEIRDIQPGRVDVTPVAPPAKRRARIRIAERAWAKGWRHFELPACAAIEPDRTETPLPYCNILERVVDPPVSCGPDCPHHEPAAAPTVDFEAERDRVTNWRSNPPGRQRCQATLERYSRR